MSVPTSAEKNAPLSQQPGEASQHRSAMRTTFGWFAERIGRRLFGDCVMSEPVAARIRRLAERGTVVYVLRHRSFLDYFLVNFVLRREGLPLAAFANGVSTLPLAPLADSIRGVVARFTQRGQTANAHELCSDNVEAGRAVLVFMRGRRSRGLVDLIRNRPRTAPVGTDYLREVVRSQRTSGRPVHVVPLGLFRGHSFRRRETGISALVSSVADVPSDTRKLLTYWWKHKDLFVAGATDIDIGEFLARYQSDLEERLVRRLSRTIQVYIHREERLVLGPALMPRRKIKSIVLDNEPTERLIRKLAADRGVTEAKVRREAERYFEEMASEFNGVVFAGIAYLFDKIWNRMFQGMEPIGFQKVLDKAKHHPIVLVPCHRSHLDYLILTYLFHLNFVSPPHIAAGINMAFFPMGYFFRSAGAFFIRRTFGDNELYKMVFRQYLTFLIREGYTQEFFIEGGRSRTGKILTPKLGMLAAITSAYCDGVRRDLYLVPVSIHYGRIVEEEAYQHELAGGEKEPESLGALMRARRFLKQKFGTIYISFADPISLSDELGDRKQRFGESTEDPEIEEEKRRFDQKLGFRILRDVNEASVAGATSISATVLLGASHWGLRYEEFRRRANATAELVLWRGITPTSSLQRNLGDFRESVDFLAGNGLIEVVTRGREDILVVKDNKRLALDFYKNNLIHAFLVPSLVGYCLLDGVPREKLVEAVHWWLDLFRWEFPLPPREQLETSVAAYVEYAEEIGALGENGIDPQHPLMAPTINALENFREAYYVAARTVIDALGEDGMSEKALLAEIRREHQTGVVVGEVTKPEGASKEVFLNALNRYVELDFVCTEKRGRGGRERWYLRGEKYAEIEPFVNLLADSLRIVSVPPPRRTRHFFSKQEGQQ
ncbi:MAG: glycerol-3-phosphate O-acyltransferase [Hyphomicrobiaceae bacterium]|jgi:glycerol-3-phosphate O-acyltransferase